VAALIGVLGCGRGSQSQRDAGADASATGTGGAPSTTDASGAGGGPESAGGAGGSSTSAGGAGGSSTDAGGAGGSPTGAGGVGGAAGHGGSGGAGEGCGLVTFAFADAPTVFLLVDRSERMFACVGAISTSGRCADPSNSNWAAVRSDVLSMVNDLQGPVLFGFGAFTAGGGTCPIFDQVAPTPASYTSIAALYDALGAPTGKVQTPLPLVLGMVQVALTTDIAPGPKYILLVSGGEPDYCSDGSPICPEDSVVARLQSFAQAGVQTMVFGVQAGTQTIVPLPALQAFANAGAGQPVLPLTDPAQTAIDVCKNVDGWVRDHTAAGTPTTTTLGSYVSTGGGTAPVHALDPGNPQGAKDALTAAISSVKGCAFEVSSNSLRVDLNGLDRAGVKIEGTDIAHDASNGWWMPTDTRVELRGTACALWRQPATRNIAFLFPCDLFIPH
jgi:hypothetical protein